MDWYVAATAYALVVVIAIARLIRTSVIVERSIKKLREVERDIKARSVAMRVVGEPGLPVMIGTGVRTMHLIDLVSTGFRLRGDDGATMAIAEGASLTVMMSDLELVDGTARLPAGSEIMYLPSSEREGFEGPLRAPGGLTVLRGDSILLFRRDAPLFAFVQRAPQLSWLRLGGFVGVCATILAMSMAHRPGSGWNAPLCLVLVMLLLDQTLLRSMLSQFATSKQRTALP
jgi:hypothetical protein